MPELGKYTDKPEIVRDLLLLVGIDVPIEIVAAQTPGARVQAARRAAAEHLRASDNHGVKIPPKPGWVRTFEMLASDEAMCETAMERWAENAARAEGQQRVIDTDEGITWSLADGAIMAQQIMLSRMRERALDAMALAVEAGHVAEHVASVCNAPDALDRVNELRARIDAATRAMVGDGTPEYFEFRRRQGDF